MNRGPLFRLLGLHRSPCPTCHRDVLWRRSSPARCRWCDNLMVDWVGLTRAAARLADFALQSFTTATRAIAQAMNTFGQALNANVWVVDVASATHEELRAGMVSSRVSRVEVIADSAVTATLVASQMVCRADRVPTRTTLVTPAMLEEERYAMAAAASALRWNPLASAIALRRLAGDPQFPSEET